MTIYNGTKDGDVLELASKADAMQVWCITVFLILYKKYF